MAWQELNSVLSRCWALRTDAEWRRRCAYTHRKQCVRILKTWRDAALRFSSGVRPPLEVHCVIFRMIYRLKCNISNSTYITTCCLGEFQEKVSSLIQKQAPVYSVIRYDWNFKWDWFLWSDKTNKMSFLAANAQDGFDEHRGKKSTSVQWYKLLHFWCCGPIFLLEVLDILFRHMASLILSIPTDT